VILKTSPRTDRRITTAVLPGVIVCDIKHRSSSANLLVQTPMVVWINPVFSHLVL